METIDDKIITLNCGLGRDSITMLLLCCEGRLETANHGTISPDDLDFVIFSDTGCEWPHTYDLIPRVREICEEHGIEFVILEKGEADNETPAETMEDVHWKVENGSYHYRPNLVDDFMSRETVASLGKGDCTDNHKIQPIRRFIDDVSRVRWDLNNRQWSYRVREKGFDPHVNLIGIAADETSRIPDGDPGPHYVTEAYPLAHMGITKADEAEVLERWGLNHVRKSGCWSCFTGDTEIVTRRGVQPNKECVGSVELLTPSTGSKGGLMNRGGFREVEVKHFGRQRIWKVELSRFGTTRTIRTTREHRWFLKGESQWKPMDEYERTTETLEEGDKLRSLNAAPVVKEKLMPPAVARGFVFGDGSDGQDERPASVEFFGEKTAVLPYFAQDPDTTVAHGEEIPWIYGVPRSWKKLPSLDASRSYLLSWLAGYFAADGHVSKRAQATIGSADRNAVEFAKNVASICGIRHGPIQKHDKRGENEINDGSFDYWRMNLRVSDLPDWFFIKPTPRKRVSSRNQRDYDYPWVVESVEPTNEVEDVYCAVVPEVGAFALSRGLMTGNCPYQPASWYWALKVTEPMTYLRVVEYEAVAMDRNPNMAATGFKKDGEPMTIPEVVRRWRKNNPDARPDEVLDKTYSRCTSDVREAQKKAFDPDEEVDLLELAEGRDQQKLAAAE